MLRSVAWGHWALYALGAWLALVAAAAFAFVLWRRWRLRELQRTAPRFPVVLAHGFMGFDELIVAGQKHHYFRKVPDELGRMGIAVYRPKVAVSSSIAARAEALAAQVRALPDKRVNLIAHSMGGLDARYAISKLGLSERVASLTTLGTPHRGTPIADLGTHVLVGGVPLAVLRRIIDIEAFWDLTTAKMAAFNREVPDVKGVDYGCVIARCHAPFMNPILLPSFTYLSTVAGDNDGVVPTSSQRWGVVYKEVEADHWAQIGWSLSFDARALYREVVQDLKTRGY